MDNVEVLKVLKDNGFDFDAKTGDGDTALHIACRYGRSAAVSFLLGAGVDKEIKNEVIRLMHV